MAVHGSAILPDTVAGAKEHGSECTKDIGKAAAELGMPVQA
jgi:hypothetical protein